MLLLLITRRLRLAPGHKSLTAPVPSPAPLGSQIMGRSENDDLSASQVFYPCMQAADIFFLKVRSRAGRGPARLRSACRRQPADTGSRNNRHQQ